MEIYVSKLTTEDFDILRVLRNAGYMITMESEMDDTITIRVDGPVNKATGGLVLAPNATWTYNYTPKPALDDV